MAKRKPKPAMTLGELKSDIDFILKQDGKYALGLPIEVETYDSWKGYHLSPGLATRYFKGKASIVWRLPKAITPL